MIQAPSRLLNPRLNLEYQRARDRQAAGCPSTRLTFFHLASGEQQEAFLETLARHLDRPASTSPAELLQEALKRELLVDRFDLYLEDYFKTRRPKGWWGDPRRGRVLARAKQVYDRWDLSVIAEYPWEKHRRFVRLPREELFYEVAYSRNRHIFSPRLQERLRQETFAIVGLGVGSAIAYLLVLCGARHFVVADGGDVTLHDHNRLLGADVRESGINHALHWTRLALRTNPYLQIRCYPTNLSSSDQPGGQDAALGLQAFLQGASLVIEEADFLPVKAAVRRAAKAAGIPVFMGADLGRTGQVQYESPSSADPILGGRLTEAIWQEIQQFASLDFERMTQLAAQVFVGGDDIPPDYQQALAEAQQAGTPFWPQVAPGAFASSRGTVAAILNYLEGNPPPPAHCLSE